MFSLLVCISCKVLVFIQRVNSLFTSKVRLKMKWSTQLSWSCSGYWLMLADCKKAEKRMKVEACLHHSMTLHCWGWWNMKMTVNCAYEVQKNMQHVCLRLRQRTMTALENCWVCRRPYERAYYGQGCGWVELHNGAPLPHGMERALWNMRREVWLMFNMAFMDRFF